MLDKEKSFKVYRYWIKINGKELSYIGFTTLPLDTRAGNKHTGSNYLNHCPKFSKAIQQYGWASFQREILAEVDNLRDAEFLEQSYIKSFNSIEDGFNESTGGRGYKGVKSSKDSKKKNSLAHINHPAYSIPVSQYSLEGIHIQDYPSIKEASRQTGIHSENIGAACKGKIKTAGKCYWAYQRTN